MFGVRCWSCSSVGRLATLWKNWWMKSQQQKWRSRVISHLSNCAKNEQVRASRSGRGWAALRRRRNAPPALWARLFSVCTASFATDGAVSLRRCRCWARLFSVYTASFATDGAVLLLLRCLQLWMDVLDRWRRVPLCRWNLLQTDVLDEPYPGTFGAFAISAATVG